MKRNRKIRCVAVTLAAVLSLGSTLTALAAENGTAKDENVYVNLSQDGSVSGIYVVNAYQLEKSTRLEDYGSYTSVRNLTSDSDIEMKHGSISVDAPAGRFYYQGNLKSREIPWDISIAYSLDGVNMEAQELAGKNGPLKITIHTGRNPHVEEAFFDNYLLQITLTMDMERCSNLKAPGATVGNVGSDRQLVYNVMAGQEKELTVTADVADFAMDPVRFQGVPMTFDIDRAAFDMSQLYDKTQQITDAAGRFSDGAQELASGTGELTDGAAKLNDGAQALKEGIDSYTDGTGKLAEAADTLKDGTQTLKEGAGTLGDGLDSAREGAVSLADGFGGDNGAVSGAARLSAAAVQLKDGTQQVAEGVNSLITLIATAPESAKGQLEGETQKLYAVCRQMGCKIDPGVSPQAGLQSCLDQLGQMLSQAQQDQENTLASIQTALQSVREQTEKVPAEPQKKDNGEKPDPAESDSAALETEETKGTEEDKETSSGDTSQTGTQSPSATEPVSNAESSSAAEPSSDAHSSSGTESSQTTVSPSDTEHKSDTQVSAKHSPGAASLTVTRVASAHTTVFKTGSKAGLMVVSDTGDSKETGTDSRTQDISGLIQSVSQTAGNMNQVITLMVTVSRLQGCYQVLDRLQGELASDSNKRQIQALQEGMTQLNAGVSGIADGAANLSGGISQLSGGAGQLKNGLDALSSGSADLSDGIRRLSEGAADLSDGASQLTDNSDELKTGAEGITGGSREFLDGSIQLQDGVDTLRTGTDEFRDQTKDIDTQIDTQIDQVIDELSGAEFTPISFVSGKNTNVELVQFAMKTDGITLPQQDTPVTEKQPAGFWQRLLELFQ